MCIHFHTKAHTRFTIFHSFAFSTTLVQIVLHTRTFCTLAQLQMHSSIATNAIGPFMQHLNSICMNCTNNYSYYNRFAMENVGRIVRIMVAYKK